MAHDRDDRGTRHQQFLLIGLAAQPDLDIGFGDAVRAVPELADDELGSVGVDDLVDCRHDTHAHQRLDDIGAALGHAVGQFLDRDRLRDRNVAHDLERLLLMHAHPLALAGAAHRGEAAHALAGVLVESAGDGQLGGGAGVLVTPRRGGGPAGLGAAAGACGSRSFVFLFGRDGDLAGGGERGDFRSGGLSGTLGDFPARLVLAAACLFFVGALFSLLFAALLCLFRFASLAQFFLDTTLSILCGALLLLPAPVLFEQRVALARLFVGLARILQRAHPRCSFFGRQRARRGAEAAPGGLCGFRGGRRGLGPRDRRRRFGPARFRRCARRDDALFANLDRDLLRAAMREALAHLARLDRPPQAERAAGAQRQGPFLLLLVRFSHALCFYHPAMPAVPAPNPNRPNPNRSPLRRETRRAAPDRCAADRTMFRRQPPRGRSVRDRTRRPIPPRSKHSRPANRRPLRPACGGCHPRHRPRTTIAPLYLGAPPRRPDQTLPPRGRRGGQDRARRSSAAPARPRPGPQAAVAPLQAAARRVQRSAWSAPAPLYPGAASTTNPVPATAPPHPGRARHPDPRQTSAIGRDPCSRWLRCSAAAATAMARKRRRWRVCPSPCRPSVYSLPAGTGSPAAGAAAVEAASSPSNQWARAFMISALASSSSSLAPPLSEAESISRSSSPARSAKSSSVLMPPSPSVTSMPGVRPSSATSSSLTPSDL